MTFIEMYYLLCKIGSLVYANYIWHESIIKNITSKKMIVYKNKSLDIRLFIFALWMISSLLNFMNFDSISNFPIRAMKRGFQVFVIILCLLQIYKSKYTKRQFITILFISIILFISFLLSSFGYLLWTWLIILAMKGADIEHSIKIARNIYAINIIVTVGLYFLGITGDYPKYRGFNIYHSYGYVHCNTFGLILCLLLATHLYINKEKLRIFDYCLSVLIISVSYFAANCQATSIIDIMLLLLIIVRQMFPNLLQTTFFKMIMPILFALLVFVSVIVTVNGFGKMKWLSEVDSIFSYRLSNTHHTYLEYGTTLLGQEITVLGSRTKEGDEKFFLDNTYAYLLIRCGLIILIIIPFLYLNLIEYYSNFNPTLSCILLIFSIDGLMTYNIFSITSNIFIIFFSEYMFTKKNINNRTNLKKNN